MPSHVQITGLLLTQSFDVETGQDQFEIATVQYVEVAERYAADTHFVHGSLVLATPSVRECKPIERVAKRFEYRFGLTRNRRAPVDKGPEHVEEECPDRDLHHSFLA